MKSQQRIQEKQKKVQELKQAVNTIKLSAQTAVEDSERIFTELISSMEKKRSEVTELIRTQEKTELSRAERLLEQLEQEIADLQRRVTELEQLSHTHDHIHFLQEIKLSAQTAVEDSERIFTELISSMEKKHSEVTELIRAQEKTELSRAERLLEQLEQEIADLQRRVTELEQLSHTHDHIHFLQEIKALVSGRHSPQTARPDFQSDLCEDPPRITVNQHLSFDGVRKSLSDLKKRLEEFCQMEFIKISEHVCECRKMAEASISVDQDQFICPVCLDLLKDPVTIPCGHSFCKVCINGCWDQEDKSGVYSCPQCRDTFTPRPVLCRNNMLAEVVEKLKKTEVQAASPAHCYAGPGDVECVASLCETHLKPHLEVPALKKHKLIEASGNVQEKICSEHDEVLKIYCRTDQSFICYLCMTDEHKSHDTVSVKAYTTEKQCVSAGKWQRPVFQ
ncbi:hypothetical protein PGIGA_G00195090 [Pangasianodon gigas]|uniref:Uncharacterized protein n=1 Tax=Pangasianodon gigas TaxID=30993 RepID=A0ACC5XXG5_PANGG|nr:hypothetical protein [Pangasianodon gigas]